MKHKDEIQIKGKEGWRSVTESIEADLDNPNNFRKDIDLGDSEPKSIQSSNDTGTIIATVVRILKDGRYVIKVSLTNTKRFVYKIVNVCAM